MQNFCHNPPTHQPGTVTEFTFHQCSAIYINEDVILSYVDVVLINCKGKMKNNLVYMRQFWQSDSLYIP